MGTVLRVSHPILSWMSKTRSSRAARLSSMTVKTPSVAAVGFGDWSSKSKQKLEGFTHNAKVECGNAGTRGSSISQEAHDSQTHPTAAAHLHAAPYLERNTSDLQKMSIIRTL